MGKWKLQDIVLSCMKNSLCKNGNCKKMKNSLFKNGNCSQTHIHTSVPRHIVDICRNTDEIEFFKSQFVKKIYRRQKRHAKTQV